MSLVAQTGLRFDLRPAQGKLIASLMAALVEFERDWLRVKADRFAPKALRLVGEGLSYREISHRLGSARTLSCRSSGGIVRPAPSHDSAGDPALAVYVQRQYTWSMRISYELQGVSFEWDSEKADTNVQKHGVSFHTACEVFFDPFVKLLDASDLTEPREAAVGYTEGEQPPCRTRDPP